MILMKIQKKIIQQIKKKELIVFDDMIPDMETGKKLSLSVTELFLRRRKPNISLVMFLKL